jgi:hypothetical protein
MPEHACSPRSAELTTRRQDLHAHRDELATHDTTRPRPLTDEDLYALSRT